MSLVGSEGDKRCRWHTCARFARRRREKKKKKKKTDGREPRRKGAFVLVVFSGFVIFSPRRPPDAVRLTRAVGSWWGHMHCSWPPCES